ncbi:hypothetical protein OPT61_g5625 [Boeremia exigua]|uniref:Uncharacterized protein n=1 Tax=Boeremia exigua TaxID=749465 RepID=A0ACC2I9P5_9PLEO|nr:hypothetical protein OPT61_g5625 [Boeremia exigua]
MSTYRPTTVLGANKRAGALWRSLIPSRAAMFHPNPPKQPDVQLEPFLAHNAQHTPQAVGERKRRQKWQTSLYLFAVLGFTVLCINIGFLLWALRANGTTDGVGILYEASCDATKRANIGIHLLINILSSAVLGASNYCMQCLSAPTRPEVDKAHRKGSWLDVGIPSLGNVVSSCFGTRKKLCWWLLGLSSLPLHLCYNSVVFMSTSAQTYGVIQFGPEAKTAIETGVFRGSQNTTWATFQDDGDNAYVNGQLYAEAFATGRLEELAPIECIDAYSIPFQSTRGNVFLVVDEGVMGIDEAHGSYSKIRRTEACSAGTGTKWIFQQFGGEAGGCFEQEAYRFLPRLRADPSTWTPYLGHRVRSCLSEPTGQKCKLNFSVHLFIIVIAFNALKVLAILISVFTLRNDPLLTVGDAVASFLRYPDATAHNMCLVSQQGIHSAGKDWPVRQHPRPFTINYPRWSAAVKRGKRWTVRLASVFVFDVQNTCLPCDRLTTGILVLVFLFFWAYISILGTKDIGSVLGIGLGSVDARTIVQSGTASSGVIGILQNVFIANSPQLPYRYALPLLGISTLLHWLASQSIFVVSVQLYNMYGEHNADGSCSHWKDGPSGDEFVTPSGDSFSISCGHDFITLSYSPLGILLSFIVAVALAIGMLVLGRKKLSLAPVVGSCSAAIAASCFARPYENAPWEKKLKWGAFESQSDQQYYGMQHCGLSSLEVVEPTPGQLYT